MPYKLMRIILYSFYWILRIMNSYSANEIINFVFCVHTIIADNYNEEDYKIVPS